LHELGNRGLVPLASHERRSWIFNIYLFLIPICNECPSPLPHRLWNCCPFAASAYSIPHVLNPHHQHGCESMRVVFPPNWDSHITSGRFAGELRPQHPAHLDSFCSRCTIFIGRILAIYHCVFRA
jgi:hypothetical protein